MGQRGADDGGPVRGVYALAYARDRDGLLAATSTLVFRRDGGGWRAVGGFPDEVDVREDLVAALHARWPALVRLERGRLHVTTAGGEAVYVPVGPSPLPACTRYGRLYLRVPDG